MHFLKSMFRNAASLAQSLRRNRNGDDPCYEKGAAYAEYFPLPKT